MVSFHGRWRSFEFPIVQFACPNGLWGSKINNTLCDRCEPRTKPSCYLASLAPNKEVDPLVLIMQFIIQFIFKGMESFCFLMAARYGFWLTLSLSGAELYEVLDVIVIDIVWCRVTI